MKTIAIVFLISAMVLAGCTLPVLTSNGQATTSSPATATAAQTEVAQTLQPGVPATTAAAGLPGIKWKTYTLQVAGVTVDTHFPASCTGKAPACKTAKKGHTIVSVILVPVAGLAESAALPYKGLPSGIKISYKGGKSAAKSYQTYQAQNKNLILGFDVPATSTGFALVWPGNKPVAIQPSY